MCDNGVKELAYHHGYIQKPDFIKCLASHSFQLSMHVTSTSTKFELQIRYDNAEFRKITAYLWSISFFS